METKVRIVAPPIRIGCLEWYFSKFERQIQREKHKKEGRVTREAGGGSKKEAMPMLRFRRSLTATLVLTIIVSLLFYAVVAGSSNNSQVLYYP